MGRAPTRSLTAVFGVTIFLGAFLLFQVQLLIGKYLLPWYGGVATVWTLCMLSFQLLLLAGYAYSHLLVRQLPQRAQRALHIAVAIAALIVVGVSAIGWSAPLLPDASFKPDAAESPAWHVIRVLAIAVGVPFFVVATTSPLLQAWFGAAYPGLSPYRFYALSNLGSLLGLLTYPTLVETSLPLPAQAWLWTVGFVLFVIGLATCAVGTAERPDDAPVSAPRTRAASPHAPSHPVQLLWIALAACPSLLLLATTNYMSQEVAAFPFLWTLPLALYLVSFIVCFDREQWYARGPWAILLVLGVTLSAFVLERGVWVRGLLQIGVPLLALFAASMVCHGELARLKPPTAHLTSFYLAITVGGGAGGAIVALVAPQVFAGIWEFPLGIWLAATLAVVALRRDPDSPLHTHVAWTVVTAIAGVAVSVYVFRESLPVPLPPISDRWLFGVPIVIAIGGLALHARSGRRPRSASVRRPLGGWRARVMTGVVAAALAVLGIALAHLAWEQRRYALAHSRTFYGMVAVEWTGDTDDDRAVRLRHGRITHGVQYGAEEKRLEPTSYYGRESGIGLAIELHPRRAEGLRIGVVGLGVGTLAAYGQSHDTIRFYEINPDVIRLAGHDSGWFTYVRESEATVEIALGDARLVLEAELARGAPQRFDVLAIDAFSSDSIPVHLLTREAVATYLAHLRPDGVLAFHISNRYLELKPVVRGLAAHLGLTYAFVSTDESELTWRTSWALLARDPSAVASATLAPVTDTEPENPTAVLWTDDYSDIIRLLKL